MMYHDLEIVYTFLQDVIGSLRSKICVFEIVDALDGKKNKIEK